MKNFISLPRPSKEDIARMPAFIGLPLDRIRIVRSPAQVKFASRALADAKFIGFDTESKPTFQKGDIRDGPHVIQFATMEQAFVVQVKSDVPMNFLKNVIESSEIVKIGFGLKSDMIPLRQKLGIRLGASVDLAHAMRGLGYSQAVGLKTAVAIVLKRRLQKSKSTTTSNWALPELRPKQLIYAANDAHASLAVFDAMGKPYAPRQPAEPDPSLRPNTYGF